jgi:hypothetical protein
VKVAIAPVSSFPVQLPASVCRFGRRLWCHPLMWYWCAPSARRNGTMNYVDKSVASQTQGGKICRNLRRRYYVHAGTISTYALPEPAVNLSQHRILLCRSLPLLAGSEEL